MRGIARIWKRFRRTRRQARKLLDTHYLGATPIELLRTEQARIATQLHRIQEQPTAAYAEFEQTRSVLADTLDLTRDCHVAYLQANDHTTRLFNQAILANIYIEEDV